MKQNILLFFCLFSCTLTRHTQAQFVSDYDYFSVFTSENPLCCLSEHPEKNALMFLISSQSNSVLMTYDYKNQQIEADNSFEHPILNYSKDPKNGKIYFVDQKGRLISKEPGNSKKSKEKLLSQRNLQLREAAFNSSGNLIALIAKHSYDARFSLMTFDFIYENLNEHFAFGNNYTHVGWSGQSAMISVTSLNMAKQFSEIRIFSWEGKHLIDIQSDTMRLSQAAWGNSSLRFVCIGEAASGYFLLKYKPDGELIETLLKSNNPISSPFLADENKKLFFLTHDKQNKITLWYLDLEL